jgi:hypothetical protein
MKKSETTKHLKRLDKAIDAAKSYRKSVRKLAKARLSADHVDGLEARVDFDIRLLRKERDRIAAADGAPAGTEPEPDVAAAPVAEPAPAAAHTGTPAADDAAAPAAAPAAKPARAPRARRAAGARTKPATAAKSG